MATDSNNEPDLPTKIAIVINAVAWLAVGIVWVWKVTT